MKAQEAEQLRKRYLYRRLIVTGRLKLHRHAAVRLIGPDCAYHLYAHYCGDDADARPEPHDARPAPPPDEQEAPPHA